MFDLLTPSGSYITEDQENVEFEEHSDRAMMRMLPQEERDAIQQQVALFREERTKLMNEISKWDASGNDIIVIAKEMCMIMMEMTDFTRCCTFYISNGYLLRGWVNLRFYLLFKLICY